MILCLDVETTTFNSGHPFDPRNRMVSYSYRTDTEPASFHYYSDPDFKSCLVDLYANALEIIGFNIKFDIHWSRNLGVSIRPGTRVWDCQLAEFILSGQTASYISLNETLDSYGLELKHDLVKDYWDKGIDTLDIPVDILEEYNNYDVEGTYQVYLQQQALMTKEQINLCYLMGQDLLTLQAAEYAGIKFDHEKAQKKLNELSEVCNQLEKDLLQFVPTGPGFSFNFDSGDHLSCLLYGGTLEYVYAIPKEATYKTGPNTGQTYTKNSWHTSQITFPVRFKPIDGTEIKKTLELPKESLHLYQTDVPTLKQLSTRSAENRSILKALLTRSDKVKVKEMIESVINKINQMNWQDNYIHGQFNQNVVVTGRLSSSGPNLQNTPPELDELLVSRYT